MLIKEITDSYIISEIFKQMHWSNYIVIKRDKAFPVYCTKIVPPGNNYSNSWEQLS